MRISRNTLAACASIGMALCVASQQAEASLVVAWAALTSDTSSTVGGSIAAPSGTVNVTYSGSYLFAQLNNTGTYYWTDSGWNGGAVNAPATKDIVGLSAGGPKTITFSQDVTNPYVLITSWNGNTPTFSAPFTVIREGCGYWGCGSITPNATSTAFLPGNGEETALLQFTGTFSTLSFTDTSENWHGFTVGIADVAGPPTGGGGVPEPATLALLGSGLLGFAFLKRRS